MSPVALSIDKETPIEPPTAGIKAFVGKLTVTAYAALTGTSIARNAATMADIVTAFGRSLSRATPPPLLATAGATVLRR
jgi:hypothetical protein